MLPTKHLPPAGSSHCVEIVALKLATKGHGGHGASIVMARRAFAVFPQAQAERLCTVARHRCWRNGDVLLEENRVVPAVMGIVAGRVRTGISSTEGPGAFFRWYGPGEVIGLVSAVGPLPYPATAVAADDCETLVVDRDTLLAFMHEDAGMAIAVARVLARHSWDLCHLIESRVPQSLTDRVHAALLHFGRLNGTACDDGSVRLGLSQQDIAEAIGASRPRVNIELRKLAGRGLIRLGYGQVLLLPKTGA